MKIDVYLDIFVTIASTLKIIFANSRKDLYDSNTARFFL